LKSLRFRIAGALGLAFMPLPWNLFHLVMPAAHAEAPAKGAPVTWSKSATIRLPLQTDEKARAHLSEIQLCVKAAGGKWVIAQSGPPTQTAFDYRAERDGLYWFTFVTVDKNGRTVPGDLDARPPHQVIMVDTIAPELSVMPLPVANRDIYLQCRIKDANPDWSSIKLDYMVGENSWLPMELAQLDTPGVFRIPHASVLEGKVRATAGDRAGNVAQRVIDLGDPTQSFVVNDPPKARPETEQVSHKQAPQTDPTVRKLPDAPEKTVGYNPNMPKRTDVAIDPVAIPDAPPAIVDPKTVEQAVLASPAPAREELKIATDPYFPPIAPAVEPQVKTPPVAEQPAPMVDIAPMKPIQQATHKTEMTTDVKPLVTPAPTGHNIIGTQRLTLDYVVENVIVGGQPKIDFWATRDNGRTWVKVHDEAAGRIPAKLVMPGDGMFGIRVKANGNGESPRSGEAPDAWVEVDTTRPTVRMLPPTLGNGNEAGTLTIQWLAHDKNLPADSIGIYHSARPDGPWLPVATGLRNEGNYRWLLPAGIGAEIYLRIEAIDRAGNVGLAELRDPVPLPQPKVKVLGIGPSR